MSERTCRLAAVQAAPGFMDIDAALDKTEHYVARAAEQGCDLIGFPECWIPGYPWFIWLNATALNMRYFGDYHRNSLVADSEAFAAIGDMARRNNIHVSLGASERDHGSLYIAQFHFDRDGNAVGRRRKLKPTHMERTVFGDGDGSHFQVVDTDIGRVGQLACWEHLQPLSKYAMFSLHEQIHVAAWPSFSCYPEAFALGPELNNAASQMYAAEGQCFVVAPCGVVSGAMIELMVENDLHGELLKPGGGHAQIFGPDGRPLCDKLPEDEEGLLIAEADLAAITLAKCFADPVGHYSRPDVTRLLLDRRPQPRTQGPDVQDRTKPSADDEDEEEPDISPAVRALR